MKIIQANKFYFPHRGAERYVLELSKLLEAHGDAVIPFAMRDPRNLPTPYARFFPSRILTERTDFGVEGLRTLGRMLWSFESAAKLRALARETVPDVLHLHNIYHQLSPSIIAEAKRLRLPTVMTLHDYHLISPNQVMFAHGQVIPLSKTHPYLDTLRLRAVKDSFAASALDAFEGWLHRRVRVFDSVYRFIAPSRFLRDRCVAYGIPAERFEVIPHFIDLAGRAPAYGAQGKRVLFVGSLSEEKGVHVLLAAMAELPDVECVIVGDGPQGTRLKAMAAHLGLKNVTFAGRRQGEPLRQEYDLASVVVVPSVTVEVFGLTVLEAYAAGKPVVASDIGGLPEVVRAGETGRLAKSGDAHDLAQNIRCLIDDPAEAERLGRAGRRLAETEYTPERHLQKILDLYRRAIERK